MSETTIATIINQKKVDRTGEALGPTWTSSKSPAKSITKKGPFLFTGEGSEIPSSISALIGTSKERLQEPGPHQMDLLKKLISSGTKMVNSA